MIGPRTVTAVAVALAIALAGCGLGLGPGPGTGDISLIVTSGFGARALGSVSAKRVPGSETVMRMLQRHFTVGTRYGGGFVESIDGHSGNSVPTDWFYYVNGVQAPQGAATTAVNRGDHIWFDLHDWSATDSIPAVVGSFPEPFEHGIAGKRYPTTIECATNLQAACSQVSASLTAAHVPTASQLLGTGSGPDTLGVVVGTWGEVFSEVASSLIQHGPSASGVYARFDDAAGHTLELLNASGRVVQRLGSGAGLIAATADSSSVPTWLVTGTDAAGVAAAAHAFNTRDLHDHFAIAVDGTRVIPLPVGSG